MVRDTPPSQDVFTHQIWNSFLKEYRRYAPDSKQFLETRSEVKVNVTGTQGLCATLCHLKMHPNTKFRIPPNTKFGIPSLNNIGDTHRTRLFKKLDQGQGHSDLKYNETLCFFNMHPHTKFEIPSSKNIGDMHWTGSRTDGLMDGRPDGQCNYYTPP